MSLVHVFCSMESYWRMLHSVNRLALFSGPKGPASLCHWMPVTMYPWCSKIHLFDLPLWMTDLHLVVLFPPSFQVDAGAGPGSKFMNLNFLLFYPAHFVSLKVIMSGIGMRHIGRLIDWSPTNIFWATHLFWSWKYVVLHLLGNLDLNTPYLNIIPI